MTISPETNIRLLKNVPLDTTYDHTIYFTSTQAQQTYFMSKQKYNLTHYSYQRVKRGYARVGIKADSLYDCNYMMFQNSAFGDKWFYAFITSVEYINNECTELQFEIDVMQTWHFDYSVDQCFVEREHSVTDVIGENIIPETCDTGEYVYNNLEPLTSALEPLAIYVMVSDNKETAGGNLYDGIFSGTTIHVFNTSQNSITYLKNFLQGYADSPDSVVNMYMAPAIGTGSAVPDEGQEISFSNSAHMLEITKHVIGISDTLDGYKPKNLKLYTYPYNFYQVSTSKSSNVYRYEFFDNHMPRFHVYVPATPPMQVSLRPFHYKGSGTSDLTNDTLVLDDYPFCSWNSDTFKAWLAQNAIPITAQVGSAAVTAGLGFITGAAPLVVGVNIFGKASSLIQQGYRAAIAADTTRGNVNSGNADVSIGTKNFYCGQVSVSKQYAKMIDDYFTRFGYATNGLKVPNRSSRPHWNYVKTVDATLTGSLPADDMQKIVGIYNDGITFWKNGDEIGDYSLDNSPKPTGE